MLANTSRIKESNVVVFPVSDSDTKRYQNLATQLEQVPDDILLAYLVTRFNQKEILIAFNS